MNRENSKSLSPYPPLLAVLLLAGCPGEPPVDVDAGAATDATSAVDSEQPVDATAARYRVNGVAMGLIEPVNVRLVATGVDEVLTLDADGPFAFAAEVSDGDGYSVQFMNGPAHCAVTDDAGTVAGADVNLEVWCSMLDDLTLESARVPTLGFSTDRRFYTAEVALTQETATLTATTTRPGVEISVAGTSAISGAPSQPVPLALGANPIEVLARHPASGAELRYEVAVNRAGPVAQAVYGKASNSDYEDNFAERIALSADGSTLAVGAADEQSAATGIDGDQTDNDSNRAGAVYVFHRQGQTWMQQAYVKASNTGGTDNFGSAVALSASGDTLAVGARWEASQATGIDGDQTDDSAIYTGAVYVFQRQGGTWAQQSYIKASNSESGDAFGESVALSATGDTLAVGADGESSAATGIDGDQSDNSALQSGAVYVFQRQGATWSQQAYLKASNTERNDRFGNALALSASGDTLAVGAYLEDSQATGIDGNQADNSEISSGAVYLFQRQAANWAQQAYIKASNAQDSDEFGYSVALNASGDTLAVGARREASQTSTIDGNQANNAAYSAGAVYAFLRQGATWGQQAYIKAPNTDGYDELGYAVGLSASGDTLLVGAPGESSEATGVDGDQADNRGDSSGAAYAFARQGGVWSVRAYIKASNTDVSDRFGMSVAVSGNGDIMIVGTPYEDSGATGLGGDQNNDSIDQSGAMYIFQ